MSPSVATPSRVSLADGQSSQSALTAPYTSTSYSRLFAQQLRAQGHDPTRLYERAQLAAGEVERSDSLLPTHKFLQFLRACQELLPDPDLGLHAGVLLQVEDLDVLGLVLRASATAQAAYELAQQHWGRWSAAHGATLALSDDGVVCTQSFLGGRAPRHLAECFAAASVTLARALAGASTDAREVRFCHAVPESVAEHRRIFRNARLVFEAPSNEVVFSTELLGQPLPHADASVVRVLTPQLHRAAATTTYSPDLVTRVKNVALENLAQGRLSIGQVAQKLHQSERALRRQLFASATNFREILNDVQRDLALHYLEQGLSAGATSKELGFPQPSSFHRAFRRWTGRSVGEYRSSLGFARSAGDDDEPGASDYDVDGLRVGARSGKLRRTQTWAPTET